MNNNNQPNSMPSPNTQRKQAPMNPPTNAFGGREAPAPPIRPNQQGFNGPMMSQYVIIIHPLVFFL